MAAKTREHFLLLWSVVISVLLAVSSQVVQWWVRVDYETRTIPAFTVDPEPAVLENPWSHRKRLLYADPQTGKYPGVYP